MATQASARDCVQVPARVSLNFSFEWPLAAQQKLARQLKIDCADKAGANDAEVVDADSIAALIEDTLRSDGIEVLDIEPFNIPGADDNGILNLVIYTALDDVENKTVILPVMVTGRGIDDFIRHAALEGAAEEGGELVLRFAVDAKAASMLNARPSVEWRRDGTLIPDETRARYALTNDDIGRVISADLVMRGPRGEELARQRYDAQTKVVAVERAPAVKGLRILGNAEEGQRLTVGYQFSDANSNDREDKSRITWRRDGQPLAGQTGTSYQLTADDVGASISVEIIPRSNDGVEGEMSRAVLAEVIRPMAMAKGQQRSTLTLPSEAVSSALLSTRGATPSANLTLQKVVEEAQQAAPQPDQTLPPVTTPTSTSEQIPVTPPQKPSLTPNQTKQRKAKQTDIKQTEQAETRPRIATPHPPVPPPPPPKRVINVPAVPLTDRERDAIAASAKSLCFELEDINLENSTVLDNATKKELLGGFLAQCTTPELVGNVLSTLNNYYIDEGYVTTRAYVAPQDLKDGSLDIAIVEGRIENIAFYEDASKDLHRINTAFPVESGDILNINDLERGLDQMNVPISNKVTMNMLPGTKAGHSVIELSEEKISPAYRVKIGLDNLGSQGTGEDRLTLGFDADNVFNYNDTWSISHIGSLDTNALALSGTIPHGYWTYGVSYSYSDYLSYIDPMTQLFGKSETMELKGDRLFFKSKGKELSFKSSITKKTSKRTIGDVRLASQRMAVARLGLGFSRKTDAVFSGNVYLARGLEILGAMRDQRNPAPGTPEAQFSKVQFDASYYQPIFNSIFLQSALAGQVADSALYGSEQITAGGKTSVRGFARNTIGGDSGFYAQNDILFPMPQMLVRGPLRDYVAAIKPFAGFDFAFTSDRATYKNNSIMGVGLGAKYAKGSFTADLGLGAPLWRNRGSRNNKIEKYVKILYEALEF
ncbi:MAG: BamA/TamA family outer membrane protein [Alphaproteobacteria bacterium]|nr:BamA/TamA family outer membrane protein [Alphaproteobacteria bacterium]